MPLAERPHIGPNVFRAFSTLDGVCTVSNDDFSFPTAADHRQDVIDPPAAHQGEMQLGYVDASRNQLTNGEWIDTARTSVRDHPIAAVGIALATGMLLARLSR